MSSNPDRILEQLCRTQAVGTCSNSYSCRHQIMKVTQVLNTLYVTKPSFHNSEKGMGKTQR